MRAGARKPSTSCCSGRTCRGRPMCGRTAAPCKSAGHGTAPQPAADRPGQVPVLDHVLHGQVLGCDPVKPRTRSALVCAGSPCGRRRLWRLPGNLGLGRVRRPALLAGKVRRRCFVQCEPGVPGSQRPVPDDADAPERARQHHSLLWVRVGPDLVGRTHDRKLLHGGGPLSKAIPPRRERPGFLAQPW